MDLRRVLDTLPSGREIQGFIREHVALPAWQRSEFVVQPALDSFDAAWNHPEWGWAVIPVAVLGLLVLWNAVQILATIWHYNHRHALYLRAIRRCRGCETLLITSAGSCRGKTTLANTLAQNKNVFVIHLDEINYDRSKGHWVRRSADEWTEEAERLLELAGSRFLVIEGVPHYRAKYPEVSAVMKEFIQALDIDAHVHVSMEPLYVLRMLWIRSFFRLCGCSQPAETYKNANEIMARNRTQMAQEDLPTAPYFREYLDLHKAQRITID